MLKKFVVFLIMVLIINIYGIVGFSQTDLVAQYNFSEDDLAVDSSKNAYNGTIHNATVCGGLAYFSRGTNSYIDLGNSIKGQLQGSSAVSVGMWFNAQGASVNSDYLFYMPLGSNAGLEIYLTPTSLNISGRSVKEDARISKKYSLPNKNKWYHIVAIWDYANKKIHCYLNGQEISSETSTKANFKNNSLSFDSQNVNAYISHYGEYTDFNGQIDEVNIFNFKIGNEKIRELSTTKQLDSSLSDSQITTVLEQKLQNATVLLKNSNAVIYDKKRSYLDYNNKNLIVKEIDNNIYIPTPFINEKYNTDFKSEYITLSQLKDDTNKNILIYGRLIIISENPIFDVINDQEILKSLQTRLEEDRPFFENPISTQIGFSDTAGLYLGSPSIIQLPNKDLICSYDYFGPKNLNKEIISKSTDSGKTWTKMAEINNLTWGSLFYHNNDIYILGTNNVFGGISIYKSSDQINWSGNELFSSAGKYHTAPVSVVKHNGRIYRAFESVTRGTNINYYDSLIISADENSDLMNDKSWEMSNKLEFDKNWLNPSEFQNYSQSGFLEGNVVVAPDGKIKNILRTTIPPYSNKGIMLNLDTDNKTLQFDEKNGIINLPGGSHKFSIVYDEVTKNYISLTNYNQNKEYFNERNSLWLIYSKDLVNWNISNEIVWDDSLRCTSESYEKTGFQYADFVIDNNDLKIVIREASGSAANYHDSNKISYYQLNDFRKYLTKTIPIVKWTFDNLTTDNKIINNANQDLNGTLSNPNVSIVSAYENNGANFTFGKANTYVSTNNLTSQINGKNAVTVSMWAYLEEYPTTTNAQLFKIFLNGTNGGIMAYVNQNKKVRLEVRSKENEPLKAIIAPTDFEIKKWQNLTFVIDYEKGELSYYLNGELQTNVKTTFLSKVFSPNNPSKPDLSVGGAGSATFNGKIDNFLIYDKAFNKNEIEELITCKIRLLDSNNNEIKDVNMGLNKIKTNINKSVNCDLYIGIFNKSNNKLQNLFQYENLISPNISNDIEMNFYMPNDYYNFYYKTFLWDNNLVPLMK